MVYHLYIVITVVQIRLSNCSDGGVTEFFTTEGIIELDLKRHTEVDQDNLSKRKNTCDSI